MASIWRRVAHYLALGPDDEYDDYDPSGQPMMAPPQGVPLNVGAPAQPEPELSVVGPVRPLPARTSGVTPMPLPTMEPASGVNAAQQRSSVVRPLPVPATAKPHIVRINSFDDAKAVGDRFKNNQPVLINLLDVDRAIGHRLVDFASGLAFGLGGRMEKLANQVFLLTPADVEVSDDEKRRLQERGFSND